MKTTHFQKLVNYKRGASPKVFEMLKRDDLFTGMVVISGDHTYSSRLRYTFVIDFIQNEFIHIRKIDNFGQIRKDLIIKISIDIFLKSWKEFVA